MDAIPLLSAVRQWLATASAGHRLPPERALAARFGVTRAELRKVLGILADEGVVTRHVGRGTFIAGDVAPPTGLDIAGRTSPLAAMQARGAIEPELARLAALNATSEQFTAMRALCAQMRQAADWDTYAELDWRFHNLIAEATGNVLLVEIQLLLNGVRRHVVWGNLVRRAAGPPPDYHSFAEHEAVLRAIETRDAGAAMRAMSGHLDGTRAQLTER